MRVHRLVQAALLAGFMGAIASLAACDKNTNGPSNNNPTWTFRIGASCQGRLNSAVQVYVDDVYKGQTTGDLQVSVTVGLHTYQAFTEGRFFSWGPNQYNVPSNGLILTLDCT